MPGLYTQNRYSFAQDLKVSLRGFASRIEVLRGPASSLYGNAAGGGNRSLGYMINASTTDLDGYREHSRANGTSVNAKLAYRPTDLDDFLLTFNHTGKPRADDPGGIDAEQMTLDRRSARPPLVDNL